MDGTYENRAREPGKEANVFFVLLRHRKLGTRFACTVRGNSRGPPIRRYPYIRRYPDTRRSKLLGATINR